MSLRGDELFMAEELAEASLVWKKRCSGPARVPACRHECLPHSDPGAFVP